MPAAVRVLEAIDQAVVFTDPAGSIAFRNERADAGRPLGFLMVTSGRIPDGYLDALDQTVGSTSWQNPLRVALETGTLQIVHDVEALRTRVQRSSYHDHLATSLEAAVRSIPAAAALRDPYTPGHQHHVAELSVGIASELVIDADQVNGIGVAASIHDIGKLAVPAEILSRPGRPYRPALGQDAALREIAN